MLANPRFICLLILSAALFRAQSEESNSLVLSWQASAGGTSFEYLRAVRRLPGGGYIAAGHSASAPGGSKTSPNYGWLDYWMVCLDDQGGQLWDQSFGGDDEDSLQTLALTADGGYILGGSSISLPSGNKTSPRWGSFDYWMVRADGAGGKLWENSYGGDERDLLQAIEQTSDGGFILGGTSASSTNGTKTAPAFGNNDFWIVRVDASGNELWQQSFGGSGADTLQTLRVTSDGGFIAGGASASGISGSKTTAGLGDYDYWVLKLDSGGNKIWERTFGGTAADQLNSIEETADGGFILAGESWSAINGNKASASFGLNDFWIVRLDAAGNKLWDRSFGGLNNDRAWTVSQTTDLGFVAGGRSSSGISGNKESPSFGSSDYWMVRLDADGNKLWDRSFGGTDFDELFSLEPMVDGYILAGESRSMDGLKTSPHFGLNDFWILKLSRGPYSLTTEANYPERGSIVAQPSPGASGKYADGTAVTLTATANAGYRFSAWTGDLEGVANPAAIVMDRDKQVRGIFNSTASPAPAVAPLSLTNFAAYAQMAPTQTFKIWNAGGSTLTYDISTSVPWLSVFPAGGLSIEDTNQHFLAFQTSGLGQGSHRATVNVAPSGDPGAARTMEVVLGLWPAPVVSWQQTFGGRNDDSLNAVCPTSDGGYLLAGTSNSGKNGSKSSQNRGSNDFWVVRIDSTGNKLWEIGIGGSGDDELWGAQETFDRGWILAGGSNSGMTGDKNAPNYGLRDFWVVRLDAGGARLWDRSFGGAGEDIAFAVMQTSDGGFVVGGESSSPIGGNKTGQSFGAADYWILRLDSGGNKVWERTFGGAGMDQLRNLCSAPGGGYFLSGQSSSGPGGNKAAPHWGGPDYWIIRVDGNGEKVWDQSFGGSGAESLWTAVPTFDGGLVVGGDSRSGIDGNKFSPSFGGSDCWVLRLDSAGARLWEQSAGGDGDDLLFALKQMPGGGFLLGGSSESDPGGNKSASNYGLADFWLVRLDADGSRLWDYSFGGSDYDEIYSLTLSEDGGLLLGGISASGANGNKTASGLGGYDYWTVKLWLNLPRLQPAPQTTAQLQSDGFRFTVTGPTNFYCVTERTTNFFQWQPLATNLLNAAPMNMVDPNPATAPVQSYRVRIAP